MTVLKLPLTKYVDRVKGQPNFSKNIVGNRRRMPSNPKRKGVSTRASTKRRRGPANPPITPQTASNSVGQSPLTNQPSLVSQPSLSNQPSFVSQPLLTNQPSSISQPSLTNQPSLASQTSLTNQPAIFSQPSLTNQPSVVSQPSFLSLYMSIHRRPP